MVDPFEVTIVLGVNSRVIDKFIKSFVVICTYLVRI